MRLLGAAAWGLLALACLREWPRPSPSAGAQGSSLAGATSGPSKTTEGASATSISSLGSTALAPQSGPLIAASSATAAERSSAPTLAQPVAASSGMASRPLSKEQCRALVGVLSEQLDHAQRCDEREPCQTIWTGGCPFGCFSFAGNMAAYERIEPLLRLYDQSCSRCVYRCIQPAPGGVQCVKGTCQWVPTGSSPAEETTSSDSLDH